MTAPDILSKVGFEKSKVGSGDKELGYQIKDSSLSSLIGSVVVCFAVMGFMVVSMVFDIHFEKKTLHRQLRVEEHHAASKLAQVQMELWSQYRDDIQESYEAQSLLRSLDTSYTQFQGKFHSVVSDVAAELNLNPVKAAKFADKILHIVADMQQSNVKHAKHLVDHLVAAGKKSVALEKHVDSEIMKEVTEEAKHIEEDAKEGIEVGGVDGINATNLAEADPLKELLEGFWRTFQDYEGEFKGKVRETLKEGHPVYGQIKDLYEKMKSDTPPSKEELVVALETIDLASVGAGLGSGRVLPAEDVVEEIALIPKIPHKELEALENEWRSGQQKSILVFEQLYKWHEQNLIPSGWLQMGVNQEESRDLLSNS